MTRFNEADFVLRGKDLKQPYIVKDGLQLYYDTKGKHNSHLHRDTLLDMSGQGKDGELSGFDYDGELSGYVGDNGLVFDGIDDKLERVALDDLSEDAFTYQLNNNVISYGGGGTVKWVKDGKVMERKGINLIKNSNFKNNLNHWVERDSKATITPHGVLLEGTHDSKGGRIYTEGEPVISVDEIIENNIFLVMATITPCTESKVSIRTSRHNRGYDSNIIAGVDIEPNKKNNIIEVFKANELSYSQRMIEAGGGTLFIEQVETKSKTLIHNTQLINLTATFGAGNEPTLEEIQADPDKWQWLPNPMDLIETTELKGNILGDMEDIVDASPRDRQSGKEVFTEHADDSHVEVEVDGQSYQPTAGNLYSKEHSITGRFYDINGLLKENITPHHVAMEDYFPVTSGEVVIEQLWNPNGTVNTIGQNRIVFYDSNKTILSVVNGIVLWGDAYQEKKHTAPEGASFFRFGSIVGVNGVIDDDIEVSFSVNYPSAPTPDYPVEIESVNDFDVVSSVGKRNLLGQFNTIPHSYVNDAGHVITENLPHSSHTDYIDISGTDSITFSLYDSISDNDLELIKGHNTQKLMLFDKHRNVTEIPYRQRWVMPNSVTLNTHGAKYARLNLLFGTKYRYKLEKGNIKTDWIPASEDITEDSNHPLIDKVNLSLSEPLRSVGDVKDRIYKDSDGLWKVERNVGELVADGSEDWGASPAQWQQTNAMSFYIQLGRGYTWGSFPREELVSNLFQSFYNRHEGISTAVRDFELVTNDNTIGNKRFKVLRSRLKTQDLNGWRGFLAEKSSEGNPLKLLYVVSIPTIETLNQELQDQLNTLKSFKGSNYVYTVQNMDNPHKEQLKPTLHATFNSKDYLKETRTLTNLLIWARELSDEELIHHNQLFRNRFNLPSDEVIEEPIEQTLVLLHGGMVGHSLEQNYTINI